MVEGKKQARVHHLVLAFLALFLISPLIPYLAQVLLTTTFVFSMVQFYWRKGSSVLSSEKETLVPPTKTPFCSIHLCCYNEPPSLVRKTLLALNNLNYNNYEVIVMDNNTKDPEIWKPIEKYCRYLGKKFNFTHIEGLKGHKAGALNECYKKIDLKTEYIFVIDADYCVKSNFLNDAISVMEAENLDYIQYPQAYREVNKSLASLEGNYRCYFDQVLPLTREFQACLLTGTMCGISRKALEEVNLWRTDSLAEDAAMGLQLVEKKFKGKYRNKVMGKGLMPYDFLTLKRQRDRWIVGNARILFDISLKKLKTLKLKQIFSIIIQLTAWFHLAIIPLYFAIVNEVYSLVTEQDLFSETTQILTLATMGFIFLSDILNYTFLPLRKESANDSGLVFHWSLLPQHCLGWIKAACRKREFFYRTNKPVVKTPSHELYFSLLMTVTIIGASATAFIYYPERIMAHTLFLYLTIYYITKSLAQKLFIEAHQESLKVNRENSKKFTVTEIKSQASSNLKQSY